LHQPASGPAHADVKTDKAAMTSVMAAVSYLH
jgi:hypothetical protein